MTRTLKGSRISSFYPVKQVSSLSTIDSAFQLQEYISLLIRHDIHDVDAIVSIPDTSKDYVEDEKESRDVTVDEACWIHEQLRRLAQDLSHPLITMLQQECTRRTCPEMKAGEWLYLCVAHGNEGSMEQCCAIDYILHTIDSATALLNSPRVFPSRLSIPPTSNRHFSSLARRLGRIFAHAFFHHREIFEQAEAESSLYARFLALTSRFDLVPPEFLVIPPRLHPDDPTQEHVEPPRLNAAAVEPHSEGATYEAEFPASLEPRKGRNRTDTMVFSESFPLAEELAKSDLSSGDVSLDDFTDSEPSQDSGSPDLPAHVELADAGVPLLTTEPEGEGLHPAAAELPGTSVDPALARSVDEEPLDHVAESDDVSHSDEDTSAPESRDVTEDSEPATSFDAVDEASGKESREHESDGEESDVTDEPLHPEGEHEEEPDGADEKADPPLQDDATESAGTDEAPA